MIKSVVTKSLVLLALFAIAAPIYGADPILRNKVPLTTEKREKKRTGKQKNTVKFKPGKGNCNINDWSKLEQKKAKNKK